MSDPTANSNTSPSMPTMGRTKIKEAELSRTNEDLVKKVGQGMGQRIEDAYETPKMV
jgi:hypothetical protein